MTPPPSPPFPWETTAPEAQGLCSDALVRLVDFGTAHDLDSLLVLRHGRIVAEAFYAPFRAGLKHLINSATKGLMGTLVGMAQQQGLVGRLDQPILDLLPADPTSQADEAKRTITIEHLLDMTSGLRWQEPLGGQPLSAIEMQQSPDWQRFVLGQPMAQPPGTGFNYNSGNSQLLSALLSKTTGLNAQAFARRHLFDPLGMGEVVWPTDPQGLSIGGYGVFMQPRDMAKLGQLYLQGGQWHGQQLLPPGWVETIAHASVDMHMGTTPSLHYAKGWWSMPTKHAYMAVGFLRQLIMVLPDLDMVVVVTGRKHYALATLVDTVVAAVVSDGPAPDHPAAQARLAESVRAVATQTPQPVPPMPHTATRISGQRYTFSPNGAGMNSLCLTWEGSSLRHDTAFVGPRGRQQISGPVGLDSTFHTSEPPGDPLVAARAQWVDEHTLAIAWRWVAEGVSAHTTLTFEGPRVGVVFKSNRGPKAEFEGVCER